MKYAQVWQGVSVITKLRAGLRPPVLDSAVRNPRSLQVPKCRVFHLTTTIIFVISLMTIERKTIMNYRLRLSIDFDGNRKMLAGQTRVGSK